MKKLVLLAGVVCFSSALMAQKPSSDVKYSLEGNINYDAGISWTAPSIRARYFVNDNIAARVQLGIGSSSDKTLVYENSDGTGGTGSYKDAESSIAIELGAEYHLMGTDKMSPYFMAGLSFGSQSRSGSSENSDGYDYFSGYSTEYKYSGSSFGLGIGAGMDYYLAENMYIGLELGWGWTRISDGGGSASYTYDGTTNSDVTPAGGSTSGMGTGSANTAFRIGWRF